MQVTPVALLTRLPPGAAAAASAAAADASPPSLALAAVGDALDVGGSEEGLLRGHGTMALHPPEEGSGGGGGGGGADACLAPSSGLVATLTGAITRVDRLVSVRPLASGRYTADLGDVVVGRVVEVGGKRWRLDLGGRAEAALLLAAAGALPGGAAARKKTAADEAAMRSLFAEGDLIAAEVQALHGDGSVLVHTRSKKYGRLAGGQVVRLRPASVRRLARQFNALPSIGVDVILGVNGWVWVGPSGSVAGLAETGGGAAGGGAPFGAILGDEQEEEEEDGEGMDADGPPVHPYPPPPPPTVAQRRAVARAAAAVRALAGCGLLVDPPSIEAAVGKADAAGVASAAMETDCAFLGGLVSASPRQGGRLVV